MFRFTRYTDWVSRPYVARGGKIRSGEGQFSRYGSATWAANVLCLCCVSRDLPPVISNLEIGVQSGFHAAATDNTCPRTCAGCAG
jgi:hypothetical protein